MKENEGGWTLVASIHEDDFDSHCDENDRWTTTYDSGDGEWAQVIYFYCLTKTSSKFSNTI